MIDNKACLLGIEMKIRLLNLESYDTHLHINKSKTDSII